MTPSQRALLWSLVFLAFGIIDWLWLVTKPLVSLPLAIFYLILVINSYYSIKLFTHVSPKKDIVNDFVDMLIGIFYILFAFHLQRPLLCLLFGLMMFTTASAKYAFLLHKIDHTRLLRKKILVDLSGIMLFALTITGYIHGFPVESLWLMTLIFAVANLLLFTKWPLYRIID